MTSVSPSASEGAVDEPDATVCPTTPAPRLEPHPARTNWPGAVGDAARAAAARAAAREAEIAACQDEARGTVAWDLAVMWAALEALLDGVDAITDGGLAWQQMLAHRDSWYTHVAARSFRDGVFHNAAFFASAAMTCMELDTEESRGNAAFYAREATRYAERHVGRDGYMEYVA